jgi:hypothetical protein
MTQTEGNHGGNRRQSRARGSSAKESIRHTEATEEGPEAEAEAKISVDGAPVQCNKEPHSGMGLTEEEGLMTMMETHGRGLREGENSESGHQGREAEAGVAQMWPTPRESMTAGANSKHSNSMTMMPKNQTKPPYPIFHRQGVTTAVGVKNLEKFNRQAVNQGKLSSSNKGKETMVPGGNAAPATISLGGNDTNAGGK